MVNSNFYNNIENKNRRSMEWIDGTSESFLNLVTEQTFSAYEKSEEQLHVISDQKYGNRGDPFSILEKNDIILFQGDSVTDCDRDRSIVQPNNEKALGEGYPAIIAEYLLKELKNMNLKFYNRAVGGNVVHQLNERWQEDTFDIKPDVLSVLIGVNDYWYSINSAHSSALETYENNYRSLIQRTLEELPPVKLIIGEPFASVGGSATNIATGWDWDFDEFQKYREVTLRMARDFNAIFIPYQSIFDKAVQKQPLTYWSIDGVHPTEKGSRLMAIAWITAIHSAGHE